MATRREIGQALDQMRADVLRETADRVAGYRDGNPVFAENEIRQAVDTPARARARVQEWIANYNSANGAGAAQAFLGTCLAAFGSSKTLQDVDDELAALESQAATVVDNVNNNAWTFEQVADWLEQNLPPDPDEDFSYHSLPIPDGYIDVWGNPY